MWKANRIYAVDPFLLFLSAVLKKQLNNNNNK